MDLALNNLQKLICYKNQTITQSTNWLIHPSAFFSCLLANLGTYTEPFIQSTGLDSSNSVNDDQVQSAIISICHYLPVIRKMKTIIQIL